MSRSGAHSLTGGVILIILGLLLLLNQLDIASIGDVIGTWWPLILVFIGAKLLWKHSRGEQGVEVEERRERESIQIIEADEVIRTRLFGNNQLKLVSQAFQTGSVQTTAGDTMIDLTEMMPAGRDARLSVSGLFGNIRVRLAQSYPVKVTARSMAGRVIVGNRKDDGLNPSLKHVSDDFEPAPKRLMLVLSQSFGDVRVSLLPPGGQRNKG